MNDINQFLDQNIVLPPRAPPPSQVERKGKGGKSYTTGVQLYDRPRVQQAMPYLNNSLWFQYQVKSFYQIMQKSPQGCPKIYNTVGIPVKIFPLNKELYFTLILYFIFYFEIKQHIYRGEWGYLDRFFLCRPFPNYPICEINVLLYFSHLMTFILESLVYPLPIFKVSKKSGRGKICGFYGTRGCTI